MHRSDRWLFVGDGVPHVTVDELLTLLEVNLRVAEWVRELLMDFFFGVGLRHGEELDMPDLVMLGPDHIPILYRMHQSRRAQLG